MIHSLLLKYRKDLEKITGQVITQFSNISSEQELYEALSNLAHYAESIIVSDPETDVGVYAVYANCWDFSDHISFQEAQELLENGIYHNQDNAQLHFIVGMQYSYASDLGFSHCPASWELRSQYAKAGLAYLSKVKVLDPQFSKKNLDTALSVLPLRIKNIQRIIDTFQS